MDIQHWLQQIEGRTPDPPSSIRPDFPAFGLPSHCLPRKNGPVQQNNRNRKRAASASSLVVPLNRDLGHNGDNRVTTHSQRSGRDQWRDTPGKKLEVRVGSIGISPMLSLSPGIRSCGESLLPHGKYDRRPRYKTRTDRYDPNQRRQREYCDVRDARPSKPKPRRLRRNNNATLPSGLVRQDESCSMSKNRRLTFKLDAQSGFFKHGRSSFQVPARGKGLPDLTFNEMDFLRHPKAHQDHVTQPDEIICPSKAEQKRQHDEQAVSTYFKAARAALGEQDRREEFEQQRSEHSRPGERSRNHSEPPLALPDNQFLGFGSKRASSRSQNEQALPSCLSWSTSPPRPPAQTESSGTRATLPQHRQAIEMEGISHSDTGHKSDEFGRPNERSSSIIGVGKSAEVGAAHGMHQERSAVARMQRSPSRHHPGRDAAEQGQGINPSVQSTESSVRKEASTYREESYHTSDILKIRLPIGTEMGTPNERDNHEQLWPPSMEELPRVVEQSAIHIRHDAEKVNAFEHTRKQSASPQAKMLHRNVRNSGPCGQSTHEKMVQPFRMPRTSLPTRKLRPFDPASIFIPPTITIEPLTSTSCVRIWKPPDEPSLTPTPASYNTIRESHPTQLIQRDCSSSNQQPSRKTLVGRRLDVDHGLIRGEAGCAQSQAAILATTPSLAESEIMSPPSSRLRCGSSRASISDPTGESRSFWKPNKLY